MYKGNIKINSLNIYKNEVKKKCDEINKNKIYTLIILTYSQCNEKLVYTIMEVITLGKQHSELQLLHRGLVQHYKKKPFYQHQ